MKKILLLVLVLAITAVFLSGCFNKYSQDRDGADGRMTVIFNDGWAIIYRDNDTGVQYLSRSNCGTCVMVNADGTPYTGGVDDGT